MRVQLGLWLQGVKVKLRLVKAPACRSHGTTPALTLLRWSDAGRASLARWATPPFVCGLFCFADGGRCVWGENRKPWRVLSTPVGTFHEFGYFETRFHETSISCYSGKIYKLCWYFKHHVSYWTRRRCCVTGCMRAGCLTHNEPAAADRGKHQILQLWDNSITSGFQTVIYRNSKKFRVIRSKKNSNTDIKMRQNVNWFNIACLAVCSM